MSKKEKATEEPTGTTINWYEALNILNKHLPEDFPRFEKIPDTDIIELIGKRDLIISTDEQGTIRLNMSPRSEADAVIQFIVLSEFTKNYRGKRDDHFFYANLPFKFVIGQFLERHAPKVTDEQMLEMLVAFQVDPKTAKRYIRWYRRKLKPGSDKEAFIIRFEEYARKPPHRVSFSFDEVFENFEVTEEQLEEWVIDRDVQRAGITIFTSDREIVYQPPEHR